MANKTKMSTATETCWPLVSICVVPQNTADRVLNFKYHGRSQPAKFCSVLRPRVEQHESFDGKREWKEDDFGEN